MTTTYKLVYFNLRTLGEPIRWMFHYMNIPFEDERVDPSNWLDIKKSYKWQQLPELYISQNNDKTSLLVCSTAICQYLANSHPEFGLLPKGSLEKARCQEIVDAMQELRIRIKPYVIAKFFEGEEGIPKLCGLRESLMAESIPLFLKNIEELVTECQSYDEGNKGDFVFGGKVCWADFFVANLTAIWEEIIEVDLLEPYPFLKKQQKAVHSIPQIEAWINKRPKTCI